MIETAKEVIDMGILEFRMMIEGKDINDVSAIVTLLNMAQGDMENVIVAYRTELARKLSEGELITEDDIMNMSNQSISVGNILGNIKEKLIIAEYVRKELTPDCFKN